MPNTKDLYVGDSDFGNVINACAKVAFDKEMCAKMFICYLLVREAHGGNLMGHFGISKTFGV